MRKTLPLLMLASSLLLATMCLPLAAAQEGEAVIRIWVETGLGGKLFKAEFFVSAGERVEYEAEKVIDAGNGTRFTFTGWYHGDTRITGDKLLNVTVDAGTHDFTAKYAVEYLVELDLGFSVNREWVRRGDRFRFTIQENMTVGEGVRRLFEGWSGDLIGEDAEIDVVVTKPIAAEAVWRTQYLVKVVSEYPGVSGGGWFDEGETAVIEAEQKVVEMNGGESRAELKGFTVDYLPKYLEDYEVEGERAEVNVKAPLTVTANWVIFHHVVIRSSHVSDPLRDEWIRDGETLKLKLNETVIWPNGTKVVFDRWEGDISSKKTSINVEVHGPLRAKAFWKLYYMVSVESEYGAEVSPSGWVERGTHIMVMVPSPVKVLGDGERVVFREWKGSIITSSKSLNITFLDSPLILEAVWVKEYRVSVEAPEGSEIKGEYWVEEGKTFSLSAPESFLVHERMMMVFEGWEGCPSVHEKMCVAKEISSPLSVKAVYYVMRLMKVEAVSLEGEPLSDAVLVLKSEFGETVEVESGETRWMREGEWWVEKASWRGFDVTSMEKLNIDEASGETLPITLKVYRTSFKVVDPFGLPVREAEIVVETPDGEILYRGRTGRDGEVKNVGPLPPLNLTVKAQALGFQAEKNFDLRSTRPILLTLPLSQTLRDVIAAAAIISAISITFMVIRSRRRPKPSYPELPPPYPYPPPQPAQTQVEETGVVEKAEVVTIDDIRKSLEQSGERLEDVLGDAARELEEKQKRKRS